MSQAVPTVQLTDLPADGVLLDVREPQEWAAGHAPSATHLPMAEVPARLGELPGDGTVYVICRAGGRSARVVSFLNANGWDAVNVAGGMLEWHAGGRPLVANPAHPGPPQVL
jgi:rhodanese-related sulfurtransferase